MSLPGIEVAPIRDMAAERLLEVFLPTCGCPRAPPRCAGAAFKDDASARASSARHRPDGVPTSRLPAASGPGDLTDPWCGGNRGAGDALRLGQLLATGTLARAPPRRLLRGHEAVLHRARAAGRDFVARTFGPVRTAAGRRRRPGLCYREQATDHVTPRTSAHTSSPNAFSDCAQPARVGGDMDFTLSEEQTDLQRTVRAFLTDKSPDPPVRALMGNRPGHDPVVCSRWPQLAYRSCIPRNRRCRLAAEQATCSRSSVARCTRSLLRHRRLAGIGADVGRWETRCGYLPPSPPAPIATVALAPLGWQPGRRGQLPVTSPTHPTSLADLTSSRPGTPCSDRGDAAGLKREPLATYGPDPQTGRLTCDATPPRSSPPTVAPSCQVLDLAPYCWPRNRSAAPRLPDRDHRVRQGPRTVRPPIGSSGHHHVLAGMLLQSNPPRRGPFVPGQRDQPRRVARRSVIGQGHCSKLQQGRTERFAARRHRFTWEHRTHLLQAGRTRSLMLVRPGACEQLVARLGFESGARGGRQTEVKSPGGVG